MTSRADRSCQADLASVMIETSAAWRQALDREVEQGREDGRQAIAALQAACQRIGDAASARHWLETGREGNFGHQPVPTWTAGAAPSSRTRTANGEAELRRALRLRR
jgi:hypothetical protein